jgi:hypothetical protein
VPNSFFQETDRQNEFLSIAKFTERNQFGVGALSARPSPSRRRAVRVSTSWPWSARKQKRRRGGFALLPAAAEPQRQPLYLSSRGGADPSSFSCLDALLFTKVVDRMYSFVYTSLVSRFEMRSCQKSARTSLVRLADQGHPGRTGAGNERLAMKAEIRQVRSLKIESAGDFFFRKITPRIRLAGRWLEQAGFKPGHRVEVRCEQPGSLSLRFLEQPEEAAL